MDLERYAVVLYQDRSGRQSLGIYDHQKGYILAPTFGRHEHAAAEAEARRMNAPQATDEQHAVWCPTCRRQQPLSRARSQWPGGKIESIYRCVECGRDLGHSITPGPYSTVSPREVR